MLGDKGLSRFEAFKTFSTFFSTVIIASASVVVTLIYNKQQLEITKKQASSQMEITLIKEISGLIPNLASEDANTRKFSAITLSLYGESAVPALVANLEDDNPDVRLATSKALALIGGSAVPKLEAAFNDKRNSFNLRCMSIYTLGLLKPKNAVQLAISAVEDNSENKFVRKDAATALGNLKDTICIPVLLKAIQSKTNVDLVMNSIWALGEIGKKEVSENLRSMLDHSNEQVRVTAIWALAKLRSENTEEILRNISMNDNNSNVRSAAMEAIEWIQ